MQVAVLGAQPLVLERAVDDDQQLVDLERLLQVVERAELHRLDRALDRGVRGHHQDLRPLAGRRRRRRARGSDRGRSAPASGCRRPARRTAAAPSSRCASRGLPVATTSCPSPRSAAASALQDLGFVVDEQDRAACRSMVTAVSLRVDGPAARCARRCRRPALARHGDRAAQSFDDVPGDRQAEPGSGPPRREVRVEDARQVLRRRCRRPRSRTSMATRSAGRRASSRAGSPRPAGAVRRARARPGCALVRMLTSASRRRSRVGHDRRQRADRGRADARSAGARVPPRAPRPRTAR